MRFQDFEGVWRITRRIDDALTGQSGLFTGQAVFEPNDEAFTYRETGTLQLGAGQPMHAERRYLWRKSGQGVEVFFDDGRPFHFIDLTQPNPTANHDCPPDWYEVEYDFADWPRWRAIWRVRGPRKDYRMTSEYRREDEAGRLSK